MKTIENRTDISFLVHTFYAQIRKDTLLGPIFNSHIADEQWPEHLEKLTDFWETNLFGIPKFKGNPTQKHIGVDKNLYHKTSQVHFGQWLNLWFQTIDAHFEGAIATKAKEASRRMAHGQFMAIYNHRPKNN
ncbi:MAG: group III truncated hemoglobin [Dokdonia sp.]|jgi:hemoglobin